MVIRTIDGRGAEVHPGSDSATMAQATAEAASAAARRRAVRKRATTARLGDGCGRRHLFARRLGRPMRTDRVLESKGPGFAARPAPNSLFGADYTVRKGRGAGRPAVGGEPGRGARLPWIDWGLFWSYKESYNSPE